MLGGGKNSDASMGCQGWEGALWNRASDRLRGTMNLLVETDRKALLERLRRIEPETPRLWGTILGAKHMDHHLRQFGV